MKNHYIVQFEICLPDSWDENTSINQVQKWADAIQKYNYSVLWAENPMSNPVIDNTKAMKSLNCIF